LIQALVMGARMAQGDLQAAAAFWWVVSMTLWLGVLWLMFRLRPAPFSATVGFAFVFCVGIPVALVLVLALAVGIGVGAMGAGRAALATAARSPMKVAPGFSLTSNSPAPPAPAVPPSSMFAPSRPPIWRPPTATPAPTTSQPSSVTSPPVARPPRAVPEPRDPVADRAAADASLQKIGDALNKYATDHAGAFPRRLDDLSAAGLIDAADLRSPRGSPFVYSWNPRLTSPLPPQYVIAHELSPGADGRRAVLYGDGRIESIESGRWGEVMRQSSQARMDMIRRPR